VGLQSLLLIARAPPVDEAAQGYSKLRQTATAHYVVRRRGRRRRGREDGPARSWIEGGTKLAALPHRCLIARAPPVGYLRLDAQLAVSRARRETLPSRSQPCDVFQIIERCRKAVPRAAVWAADKGMRPIMRRHPAAVAKAPDGAGRQRSRPAPRGGRPRSNR